MLYTKLNKIFIANEIFLQQLEVSDVSMKITDTKGKQKRTFLSPVWH